MIVIIDAEILCYHNRLTIFFQHGTGQNFGLFFFSQS